MRIYSFKYHLSKEKKQFKCTIRGKCIIILRSVKYEIFKYIMKINKNFTVT